MSITKSAAGIPAFVTMLHWMLVAVAFSLPLPGRIPVPVLSVTLLFWFTEIVLMAIRSRSFAFLGARFRDAGKAPVIIAFLLLILVYIAGIFWSDNPGDARFELEKKSMLLLFPLLMFSLPRNVVTKSLQTKVFIAFLAGLGGVTLWSLSTALLEWFQNGDTSVLFYSKLAAPHHPSYLSMYSCFAVAVTFVFFIRMDKPLLFRILMALLLLWWIAFTVLLSSRAGMLVLGLVLLLFLIRWIGRVSARLWIPVLLLVLTGCALLFTLNGSPLKTRMGAIRNIRLSAEQMHEIRRPDGVVVRVMGWNVAMEQIREKPWLGTGTGDYHHDTRLKLEQHQLIEPFGGFRNSHNQYLQTTATLGVLGLIALLLWLFLPPLWLKDKRSWIYGMFVMIIALNLAVESMLEVQAGILFIIFFQVFLYRTSLPERTPQEEQ